MKIFFLKPNENWFGDAMGDQFKEFSRHDVNFDDPQKSDFIWIASGWCWKNLINQYPDLYKSNKKVICTIHHIFKPKFDLDDFQLRQKYCKIDMYHVPCEQSKQTLMEVANVPEQKIKKIGYWVNTKLWFEEDRQKCREEFGIKDGEYVISSFQRDGEGSNPMIPKNEKNPQGFLKFVENVSKERKVKVLLNAWRRNFVIDGLKKLGVPYVYKELPPQDVIRRMYLATQCYVASGLVEGGCQALLESSVLHVGCVGIPGVGMVDVILPENCRFDISQKIYYPTSEDVEKAYQNVQKYRIEEHIKRYDEFFESLI